jgi:hypothetical protein
MQDLLQHIDRDYYRSARLLMVRAEIAQLRRQSSASAPTEQTGKIPVGRSSRVDDFDQAAPAPTMVQSSLPGE